ADLISWLAAEPVLGRLVARLVVGPGTAFGLPLDAAAIDQLHLVVAVVLEGPVGVGGEPVVVVAVKQDGRVGADAAAAEHALERLLRRDVAEGLVLQVLAPVPGHGACDVAALVCRR